MSSQYQIRDARQEAVLLLQNELNLPAFVARILVGRGYDTPQRAWDFLNPSLERDWLNPYDIPGLEDVVDRLDAELASGGTIVVFGDFDLDGISATTVMTRGLRALGAKVSPFIPRRADEGYGLSEAAFKRAQALGPDLIVTVDCGISCRAEVDLIRQNGVDVVITDHHEASEDVPVGVALCDPKTSPDCPSSILAGVGVALKVIQALGSRHGYPNLWRSYTDFATLGTVADLMPLVGENRALVADGIRMINGNPRPCIKALMECAGYGDKDISSTNLSFSVIPRLNAAGRMGDAQVALDLLLSDNYEDSLRLAMMLEDINNQRRKIESELSEVAREQAKQVFKGQRALVVAGDGWHEGVKGIVASRLVGEYGVPTILFSIENGEARGSGRSIGNINLYEHVAALSDMLTRFGGHEAAVGVTLPEGKLEEFNSRLCQSMGKLDDEAFCPKIEVDAQVSLSEMTLENIESMYRLAPFGQDNKEPMLLAKDVVASQCRAVGADKTHLSCVLTDGCNSVSAIEFHCPDIDDYVGSDLVVDAIFRAQIDEWRGRRNAKLIISSMRFALEGICSQVDSIDVVESLFARVEDAPNIAFATEGVKVCEDAAQEGQGRSAPADDDSHEHCPCRLDLEKLEEGELLDMIVSSIIGDNRPHDAQACVLDLLGQGVSTLGVMGTGRGKSLIFQSFAALMALKQHKASLFVYPLRALMSDQAYGMSRKLSGFGIECAVLNGECSEEDRARIYERLREHAIDIVLTTPEFLQFNAERIIDSADVGFVVIDEAHHIGQAKAGQRDAYGRLGAVLEMLGNPLTLAVTATASDQIANDIYDSLGLGRCVVDRSRRENLKLDDKRSAKDKNACLSSIVASGQKTVVYVNSREQSVTLARRMRASLPHLAPRIAFYNAGLSKDERMRIESLFREGQITTLVSTSAFGEGIDIPDIEHVVLYHMPFSDVEFNQMSGRAGRDGRDATVHLLFSKQDAKLNDGILSSLAPGYDSLARIYKGLRAIGQDPTEGGFVLDIDESLPERIGLGRAEASAIGSQAAFALGVFRELGLIDCKELPSDGCMRFKVCVKENPDKVDLKDSARYCEGLAEVESFHEFKDWIMRTDPSNLRERIICPIAPSEASEVFGEEE